MSIPHIKNRKKRQVRIFSLLYKTAIFEALKSCRIRQKNNF